MKKYVTRYHVIRVEAVEVEKETADFVWINGRCRRKESQYEQYHDTFDDAKRYLITRHLNSVSDAKNRLQIAKTYLGMAESLKSPD